MGNDKQGSCYCGDIGYEISGEPLTCYACHCSECQTKTGGAFALTIVLPETSLSLTKGEPREWLDDRGDSQVLTRLCGNCGWSPLVYLLGCAWCGICSPGYVSGYVMG